MSRVTEEKAAEVFIAALDRVGEDRRSFLDRACKGDAALLAKVQRLLAADDPSSLFLAPPGERAGSDDVCAIPAGTMVGRYRIVRMIAAGGMGTVYEAEQESPSRTVALKVMKRGLAARSALRRFEHESQFLARLRHPGIAQVHDVGIYDDGAGGTPFFVMEYIPDAESLTDHARSRTLNTRARLELFCTVCDAVQHGHQKGVIHRDIKPDNILVDAAGAIKVIDFGVARASDADVAVTAQTDVGQLIGTLQYMSPEQVEADPHDLDVRSDVYSLGVVLYESLCGRLPYDVSGSRVFEAARVIREDSPKRPSTIDRSVRGDLETILLKALEKDRERRYQSVAELAADIRRCLANQPITARPPSVLYQLRTFARRNRALVGVLAMMFVVLVAGLIALSFALVKVNEARESTEQEAARALEAERQAEERAAALQQVVDFQAAAIRRVNPESVGLGIRDDLRSAFHASVEQRAGSGDDAEALLEQFDAALRDVDFTSLAVNTLDRALLSRSLDAIERDLHQSTAVQLDLLYSIGETYSALGVTSASLEAYTRGHARAESTLGAEHPGALRFASAIATVLLAQGQFDEAERLFREVLGKQRAALGDDHIDTIATMTGLGVLLRVRGRLVDAGQLYNVALASAERTLGPDHSATLALRSNLAVLAHRLGRSEEARDEMRRVVERRVRVFGRDHVETLRARYNLGAILSGLGELDEAQVVLREVVEVMQRVLGVDHSTTLGAMNSLAVATSRNGDVEEAIEILEALLGLRRRLHGEDHPGTLTVMNNLVIDLFRFGRYAQAEPLARERLHHIQRRLGDDRDETVDAVRMLGLLLRSDGRLREALPLYLDVYEQRVRLSGPEHVQTLLSMVNLCTVLTEMGELEESEPYCRSSLEVSRRVLGDDHPATLSAMTGMGMFLARSGDREDAEALYRRTLEMKRHVLGPDDAKTLACVSNLAGLLMEMGRVDEAIERSAEALEGARRTLPRGHWHLARYLLKHGQALRAAERFEDAASALLEAQSVFEQSFKPMHAFTLEACAELADLYERWHAAEPGSELDSAAAKWRHAATGDSP